MTPCLSHNFAPMYLKRNTTTRLLNLRTLLCMQLLTYETVFEYIVWPIRRTVRRVHCKKDTTLHNVLTYRVMPVWKYSHTRTCLCAMCRQIISICFMTSVVFPRKYLDFVMFMHKFTHKKACLVTLFSYGDVSEYSWPLAFHYFVWCERTINVMFTLKTLLGCVYVQLLTYKAAFLKNSLSWPTCLHASSSTKNGGDQSEHSILSRDLSLASLKTSCSNTR